MDRIIVNNDVRDRVINISELKENEKYLGMILLNKISYSYLLKNKDKENKDFVSKSLDNITKHLTGDKGVTNKLVKALVNNGLVERGTSYQVGSYSKGFKPLFNIGDRLCTVKASDYLTNRQLSKLEDRIIKARNSEIEWHRMNIIKNVELDRVRTICKCIDFFNIPTLFDKSILIDSWSWEELVISLMSLDLKGQDKKIMYRRKILELIDLEKTEIKKGSKGGRHYHCLSNAPREIKKLVVSKDPEKPFLWQIDIKNSQPFFLLALLLKGKYKIEESLKADVIGGTFYETIGLLLGYKDWEVTNNQEIRNEVKKIVFRDIFFCESNIVRLSSPKYQMIKKRFPLYCSAIEDITEKNKNRTLASLLQEIESKEVLPVVKKHKGFGIHDSILVIATSNVEEIQEIAMELERKLFKKYKLKASTSIEKISERLSDDKNVRCYQLLEYGIDF